MLYQIWHIRFVKNTFEYKMCQYGGGIIKCKEMGGISLHLGGSGEEWDTFLKPSYKLVNLHILL